MNIVLGIGSAGIDPRWRPYSYRAPAAELYRRGLSDRRRIGGTVRRHASEISRIPARRAYASSERRSYGTQAVPARQFLKLGLKGEINDS